jgi:rod shape-determining protein MreB
VAVLPGPLRLALDLGTTTTRLAIAGRPGRIELPTCVRLQADPAAAAWIGDAALPERPGTRLLRPVVEGSVQDFDALDRLLAALIRQHAPGPLRARWATVAVPSDATDLERRALVGSLHEAGVRRVALVPTGLAAAIGCQLPADRPRGSMVIHVGAARSEVVVVCFGAIVARRALRIGGQEVDKRLLAWIRTAHELLVWPAQAEALKRSAAGGGPLQVEGRVLGSGEARVVPIDRDGLRSAASEVTSRLRDAALEVLREIPADVCADLIDSGVLLTGGGASVPGLADLLRDATQLPVLLADHPASRVIDGLAAAWTEPAWAPLLDLPT